MDQSCWRNDPIQTAPVWSDDLMCVGGAEKWLVCVGIYLFVYLGGLCT